MNRSLLLFTGLLLFATLPLAAQNYIELKTITGSDVQAGDSFGYAMDADGDYLVVGAPNYNSNAGAVYIFYRNEGGASEWGEVARITHEDDNNHWFGSSVSISEDLLLIGARRNRDSDINAETGAFLYAKEAGTHTWTFVKNLTENENPENYGNFSNVAISGDNAIVGTPANSSVYHYYRNTGGQDNWGRLSHMWFNQYVGLGSTIDLTDSQLILGYPGSSSSNYRGTVSIFDLNGEELVYNDGDSYNKPETQNNSGIDMQVAISEAGHAVGAPDQDGERWSDQGAVYLNKGDKKLTDFIQDPSHSGFGRAIDMSGNVLMVGAEERVFFYDKDQEGDDNWGILNFEYKYNQQFGNSVALNEKFAFTNYENSVVVYERGNIRIANHEKYLNQVLTFDETGIYQTSTIELQLTNMSAETQSLSAQPSGNASFSMEIGNTVVSPGESVMLEIQFTPQSTGTIRDTLYYEDTDGFTYPIAVTGLGSVPHVILDEVFSEVSAPSFINVIIQLSDDEGNWLSNYDALNLYDIKEDNAPISETEALPQIGSLEDIPLTIKTALILDNSFSIGANLDALKQAATLFVENKFPQQEIAIYVFSENIVQLQDYTANLNELKSAIGEVSLGPASTNLYGAVVEGMGSFERSFSLSGIVEGFGVLFTDGEDTQSSSSLSEVISARGSKRLVTVGVGASADVNTLNTLSNAGAFTPSDYDELPAVFNEIQEDIVRFANSYYWFSYVSPKRGESNHYVEIRIKNNPNVSSDSFVQARFNSNGFSSVFPGVYVNRSFSKPLGVDTLTAVTDGPLKTKAESLFKINASSYTWSVNNSSVVNVEVDSQDNAVAYLRPKGSINDSAEITVTDTGNNYSKTFLYVIEALATSSEEENLNPDSFQLFQNYPNPFNPVTTIGFILPEAQDITLEVFDITGRKVGTLLNRKIQAGEHAVTFNATNISSGVYFYRLTTEEYSMIKKMTLIK